MTPKKSPQWNIDTFLKWCSLAGLCVIVFIAVAVVQRHRLPPGHFLSNAFTAAEAWYQALKDSDKRARQSEMEPDDSSGQSPKFKVRWDKQGAYQGYTLFSYRASTMVYLVDMEGNTVYRWDMPFDKVWPNPPHVHSLTKARVSADTVHVFPNGDLLMQYSGLGDTPYGYGLVKIDKDSKVIWTYADNAHHDFHVDEDTGNIYALTQKIVKTPLKGLEKLTYPLLTDDIVILSPEGKEIRRIPVLEAFRDSPFGSMLFHGSKFQKQKNWDALHTNSVRKLTSDLSPHFPMFTEGQILVSVRNMNAVAVIDPMTGKVVWAHKGGWKWQHAARFLPNGHIMVLDNLGYRLKNRTYIKVEAFNPGTLISAWHFTGTPEMPLRSAKYGRLQRLANDNTLITVSQDGRVLEVTANNDIVWDCTTLTQTNKKRTVVNATRYLKEDLPFLKDVLKE